MFVVGQRESEQPKIATHINQQKSSVVDLFVMSEYRKNTRKKPTGKKTSQANKLKESNLNGELKRKLKKKYQTFFLHTQDHGLLIRDRLCVYWFV